MVWTAPQQSRVGDVTRAGRIGSLGDGRDGRRYRSPAIIGEGREPPNCGEGWGWDEVQWTESPRTDAAQLSCAHARTEGRVRRGGQAMAEEGPGMRSTERVQSVMRGEWSRPTCEGEGGGDLRLCSFPPALRRYEGHACRA